jgi:hypothetical protein
VEDDDHRLAEGVLKYLLQGAAVGGIRFGQPQLLVDHVREFPVRGQVYINLASRWAVFMQPTPALPKSEDDLPERPADEELRLLCSLGERTIERVYLGREAPHLMLHLEGGSIFFLWGDHAQYESWQAGVAHGDPAETWLVVAGPGAGVAVWAPEGFKVPEGAG